MLDKQLIIEFRDYVNSNDWTLFYYKNKGGQNLWNCICSAMDWIDVATQYMCCHPLSSIRGEHSIELFSYIACVDMVMEAVEQLHRVICSTTKQVFRKDHDCFLDNPFQQTDREYFKTIRSCFGAHPVNLKEPGRSRNNAMRRFASWSGGFAGPGDFSVILYSNRVNEPNTILGIHYCQIEQFVEKYYGHLSFLKRQLEQQYEAFCQKKKEERFVWAGTPIARLKVLQKECKKRLDNDYYRNEIDELLRTFRTHITYSQNRKLVRQYLNFLCTEIDEIETNLQNMTLVDLKKHTDFDTSNLPLSPGWGYSLEKLNDARLGYGYPSEIWAGGIRRVFQGQFVFKYETAQELYVLVQAAIYHLSCKQQLPK